MKFLLHSTLLPIYSIDLESFTAKSEVDNITVARAFFFSQLHSRSLACSKVPIKSRSLHISPPLFFGNLRLRHNSCFQLLTFHTFHFHQHHQMAIPSLLVSFVASFFSVWNFMLIHFFRALFIRCLCNKKKRNPKRNENKHPQIADDLSGEWVQGSLVTKQCDTFTRVGNFVMKIWLWRCLCYLNLRCLLLCKHIFVVLFSGRFRQTKDEITS